MSTVTITDLVQLAEVDSANLHVYEVLGAPAAVKSYLRSVAVASSQPQTPHSEGGKQRREHEEPDR